MIVLVEKYGLRDYQKSIIEFVVDELRKRQSVAIESPTGSGKTIMSLLSAIRSNENQGKKILYLTRTNSQQEQVIAELRSIGNREIKAVVIQGRGNMCPLYRELENEGEFDSESLSRFCSMRKKKVMEGDKEACHYFNWKVRDPTTSQYLFSQLPTAEEFYAYGKENLLCPYESVKFSLKEANLVIAPYAFFLNYGVANRFLSHWGVSREELIIILDEAHNLPDLARNASSFRISINLINSAEKESLDYGDIELMERIRSTDLMEMLRNTIMDLIRDRMGEKQEVRIKFQELRENMMIANSMSSEKYNNLITYLSIFGEFIAEEKEKKGHVPRSSVFTLSNYLMSWETVDEEKFVAVLSRQRNGQVEAFCMDPSVLLIPLRESKTIHMSGTLSPIDVYLNVTGFQDSSSKVIPYMFPRDHLSVMYYEGTTTKYDEFDATGASRLYEQIKSLISEIRRNTIVFFPSYNVLQRIYSMGFPSRIMVEERGKTQSDLMDMISNFRKGGRTLFAVSGGRIAEGMNFPGNQLEFVIIAGIPYPRPDAKQDSIYRYYDRVFRKGWEYAVTYPTVIKIKQEIGRLIRNENDIGMAMILDKRARYFKKYIPEMKLSQDPLKDSMDFFRNISGINST